MPFETKYIFYWKIVLPLGNKDLEWENWYHLFGCIDFLSLFEFVYIDRKIDEEEKKIKNGKYVHLENCLKDETQVSIDVSVYGMI